MTSTEFTAIRKKLEKTQKQLCEIVGGSVKAICSYEQGRRPVPAHVERQLYFLLSRSGSVLSSSPRRACWTIKKCPTSRKKTCPAWEFKAGKFCWLVNNGGCQCLSSNDCTSCVVMASIAGN